MDYLHTIQLTENWFHAERKKKELGHLQSEVNLLPAFALLSINVGKRKRWREKQDRLINIWKGNIYTQNTQQTQWKKSTWQVVETSAGMKGNKGIRHNSCGGKAKMSFIPCSKEDSYLKWTSVSAKVEYTGWIWQHGYLGYRTGYLTYVFPLHRTFTGFSSYLVLRTASLAVLKARNIVHHPLTPRNTTWSAQLLHGIQFPVCPNLPSQRPKLF